MQNDKLYTCVHEWNFDKMSFMVDLKIDKRIAPSQKSCFI